MFIINFIETYIVFLVFEDRDAIKRANRLAI